MIPADWDAVARLLEERDIRFYPRSVRQIGEVHLAFAKHGRQDFVVSRQLLPTQEQLTFILVDGIYLYPLDWSNYLALRDLLALRPSTCDKPVSLGTVQATDWAWSPRRMWRLARATTCSP